MHPPPSSFYSPSGVERFAAGVLLVVAVGTILLGFGLARVLRQVRP